MSIQGIFPIEKWNFRSDSILADLPAEEYALLYKNIIEQHYKKGEIIFKEGAVAFGIYFIRQGKVKKYKIDKDGKEQIIYVANSGDLIGYHAILSNERYQDTAATIEDCSIAFILKEDFLATLDQSPLLAKRLLRALSHEFTVLANSVSVLARHSVRERLAITLIVLREKYKTESGEANEAVINLSRNDLASMVGTAEENVVRLLKDFRTEGLIETKGRMILIKDVKKLVKISNYQF
ncbi:Crp/Fnr family transcriptional regulator [Solitalea lacus]|uniref:Crp/Fnr family transcriptional regulator n=1 Tax=Solitalea lacus TaxID=2911172 RepID=UPI001EDB8B57|nr:Crp/Fnr family transcriptional regulator [Solitalea lacus]UKJ06690.1 Crp/Fnr family transcriptional regulator [Solitalea lacus]